MSPAILVRAQELTTKIILENAQREYLTHLAVVGLGVPRRFALDFQPPYAGSPERPTRTRVLRPPKEQAVRLFKFAKRHFVEGEKGFDCATFTNYLMGWGDSINRGRRFRYDSRLARPQQLVPFQPYAILLSKLQSGGGHFFIGLPNRLTLSVFGDNSGLIIAEVTQLIEAYGTDTLLALDGATPL